MSLKEAKLESLKDKHDAAPVVVAPVVEPPAPVDVPEGEQVPLEPLPTE